MASSADVNADGYSDLVVGAPSATAAGLAGAGIVDIHYPHISNGLSAQRFGAAFFGETPAAGDHFGAATTYTPPAQLNGCYGLVIGAPGADGGAGSVTLAYGTNQGISPDDATVLTGAHPGDHFGAAVAAANHEIWIAAPDESVDGHAGAGAVYHYDVDSATSTATLVQEITENSAHVPGTAAAGDHFGQALAFGGDLVVGIPGKTVDGAAGAGAVAVLRAPYPEHGLLVGGAVETQDSPGVPGGAEPGDGLGSSVTMQGDIAVGVPGEDIGSIRNAGAVQTFDDLPTEHPGGPTVRLAAQQAITQESPTVPGGSEPGDRFGAAVQLGAGDGRGGYVMSDLWIGAPGESIGDVRASGDVIHLVSAENGLFRATGAIRLGTAAGDIPGSSQAAAHVGASLGLFSASDAYAFGYSGGESVVIDVPALDSDGVNTGEVFVTDGPSITGAGAYQDSAGPQPGEFFGGAATNISNGSFDD